MHAGSTVCGGLQIHTVPETVRTSTRRSCHLAGHLAELESTAWKDDRRFRVLVADAGALSFADLYLNTPTKVSSH
jgi:hypothetical protein